MRRQGWRIGILGAGYIADWHWKALRNVRGAQIVAVCDRDVGRARSFAERYGVPASFGDVDEMLAAGPLDAVHVLLPPDLHFGPTQRLLEAGIHVYLEKPACTSVGDCEKLQDLAAAKGRTVGVGHNFLFAPIWESLRNDVRAGRLGPLSEISIAWNKELGQLRGGPFGAWMLREPGNVMLEVGPHTAAHLLDLVGEPERLHVETDRPLALPSGVTFQRRWHVSGRRGETQIDLHFNFAAGYPEQRVHVRGLAGSATADFEAGTYVLRRPGAGMEDFARYSVTASEAKQLKKQARGKLRRYVLSKFKLSRRGNDFGTSIARALHSFYEHLGTQPDPRLSLDFATRVVGLCSRISQAAQLPAAPVRPSPPAPKLPATILVLGGTGFIGQDLVRQLVEAGHGVRLLARDPRYLPLSLQKLPVEAVRGDIANAEDLDRALEGIRTVIHLARAHVKSWPDYQRLEIGGTRTVAEACLKAGVSRLLYTGTIDSLYTGDRSAIINESMSVDPKAHRRNLYARAKAESEHLLQQMHRERGLPVSILRPGVVLGKGGSPFHWGVGMWYGCAVCKLWGRGDNALPIVLVDDVSRALVRAMDADGVVGETFNLVGEPLLTARDYIRELEKAAGLKIDARPHAAWRFYGNDMFKWIVKVLVRHPERRRPSYRDWQTRAHLAHFDCSKAKRLLGWMPESNRDAMIQKGIVEPAREWLA